MKMKNFKNWLPLFAMVILFLGATGAIIFDYYSIKYQFDISQSQEYLFQDYLLYRLNYFKEYAFIYQQSHPVQAALLFSALYTLSTALSLPIAVVLTLLGGFLFGKIWGTALVVISATAGATCLFLVARTSLGTFLKKKAGKWYLAIGQNIQDNAFSYLLFLRLVPLCPFFVVNILPALFQVPLRTFLITTFVGIIPGSFVYVNLGEELSHITRLNDLVSPNIIGALALLGMFALIPSFVKMIKSKFLSEAKPQASKET